MKTSLHLALLKVTCLKVTSSQITSFYVILGNFILCSRRLASLAVCISWALRSGCLHLPDCDPLPRRGCSFLQQPLVTDTGPFQTPPSHNPTVACTLSCFSCVRLFAMLWTVACQAPLSMAFSRQEHWNELPCLPSGGLSNPGIEPASPALLHRRILPEPQGEPDPPLTGAQTSPLLAHTPTIFPVTGAQTSPLLARTPTIFPVTGAQTSPLLARTPTIFPVTGAQTSPLVARTPTIFPVTGAQTSPLLARTPTIFPVTGAQTSLLARTPTMFPPWPTSSCAIAPFHFAKAQPRPYFKLLFQNTSKAPQWSPISGPVGSQSQT